MTTPDDVLAYWFGPEGSAPDARSALWWGQVDDQQAVDDEIESRFGEAVDNALDGGFEEWLEAPESCLALILLLDQFPRHIYRGTARAFDGGDRAVATTLEAIGRGYDRELDTPECVFLYMPLMHAEDEALQERSIEAYRELAERAPEGNPTKMAEGSLQHAREHAELIERFGRYPHRNPLLDRESTPEEQAYLDGDEGRDYGQSPT